MKVFISWSGKRSNYVAKTLYEWIPRVIQTVQPWLSEEMPKGVRWSPEIAKALEETNFGVVCVTPENQGEAWLNFEAGALSKTLANAKVCAYLIDFRKTTDVVGPLKDFQLTQTNRDDTFRLMKTMNAAQGDAVLSDKVLEDTFDVWWARLEEKLNQIPAADTAVPKTRNPQEIQEETLGIVRNMEKSLTAVVEAVRSITNSEVTYLPIGTTVAEGFVQQHGRVGRVGGGRTLLTTPGFPERKTEEPSKGERKERDLNNDKK
jgi:TIR domain